MIRVPSFPRPAWNLPRRLCRALLVLTLASSSLEAFAAPPASESPKASSQSPEDGGLNPQSDKTLIRSVIAAHRDEIRTCYERALEHVPELWGKVTVRFIINPDGSASAPSIVESTVGNRELEQCLFGKLVTWRFPRVANGVSVVVTYPFLFKQRNETDAGVPDAGT